MTVKHPAKYSTALKVTMQEWLSGYNPILDPCAGVGSSRIEGLVHNEIEYEWASQCPAPAVVGNALKLPFKDDSFEAAVTSPTYANRMADSHVAKDRCKNCNGSGDIPVHKTLKGSQLPVFVRYRECPRCEGKGLSNRNTYTHKLGRKLHPDNTGQMQWGDKYQIFHLGIYTELRRVLKPQRPFVLSISDHIRNGEVVLVTQWHIEALESLSYTLIKHEQFSTPRMRQGANHELRVEYESLLLFTNDKLVG